MDCEEALNCAGLEFLNDRYDEAELILKNQLAVSPNDHRINFNMALIKSIRGEFDECTDYCNRTLAIEPGFVNAVCMLAEQRLRDGRWREGFRLYENRFLRSSGYSH